MTKDEGQRTVDGSREDVVHGEQKSWESIRALMLKI